MIFRTKKNELVIEFETRDLEIEKRYAKAEFEKIVSLMTIINGFKTREARL